MIFFLLLQSALSKPVYIPEPDVRGAATKAHVDDFFRTYLNELSKDRSIKVRNTSSLNSIREESAIEYMKSCAPGEQAGPEAPAAPLRTLLLGDLPRRLRGARTEHRPQLREPPQLERLQRDKPCAETGGRASSP